MAGDWFDRQGHPIADIDEWGRLHEDLEYKILAKTRVGDVMVSTVWLGFNYRFGPGPPLIFETMVFGGKLDDETDRYATEAESLAGHERMVRRVRGWRFWVHPRDVTAEEIAAYKASAGRAPFAS